MIVIKTIIVTGGNSGIGFEACLQFAELNHKVLMICRNEEKAKEACLKISKYTNNPNVSYLLADLSSVSDVKNIVNYLIEKDQPIDVLINNAADFDLSNKYPKYNEEGIEKQFCTNVVAPYILSEGLIPLIKKGNGKIINISTKGLVVFPKITLDFHNLNSEKKYKSSSTYYQNKLALLMVTLFMKEKYREIQFNSIRVTNVKVDISKFKLNFILRTLYKIKSSLSISPSKMAKVYVELAINNYEGFLYDENVKEVKANKFIYRKKEQEVLYDLLNDKMK